MIIIKLPNSWMGCPTSWQNMIDHLLTFSPRDIDGGVTSKEVSKELRKYKAKYNEFDDGNSEIVFESEQYYLLFLLKWS